MDQTFGFLDLHFEMIVRVIVGLVATAGFAAFFAVWRCWPLVGPYYQELWAKLAISWLRPISAGIAISTRLAPVEPGKRFWEQPWAITTIISAVAYLLWEITGQVGDDKYKKTKEKTAKVHQKEIDDLTEDLVDAEFLALRYGWLLSHLRSEVNEKRRRAHAEAARINNSRPTIQNARDGLDPRQQVRFLLEFLTSLFRLHAIHEDSSRFNQNFRAGLYAEVDGGLVPLDAFDLATRSHDPFTSFEQHADRFRLDNDKNPSHAVRCVQEGKTLIVEDCTKDPLFEVFNEKQRSYLLSMVAHPLHTFAYNGVSPARAALLVDTNQSGFFREDDRETLELLLREFAARIDLEYVIGGLTAHPMAQRGGSDE